MAYATLLGSRQIFGVAILSVPAILMIWGWVRLVRKRPSDPPILSFVPSAASLLLMTISYGLTLAQIFSRDIERYLFNRWHTSDMAVYLLISFLACVFALVSRSPIRWQVFGSGSILTILYFAMFWSLMD